MFYRKETHLNTYPEEAKEIIEFFTCKAYSPKKYTSIIASIDSKRKLSTSEKARLESGRLSHMDIIRYKSHKINLLYAVVENLVQYGFLMPFGNDPSGNTTYMPNEDLIRITYSKGILDNILGVDYVLDKYKMSVVPIVVKSDGLEEIGTGFIVKYCAKKFVITNAHVVVGFTSREIIDHQNNPISEKNVTIFEEDDLAIIEIDNEFPCHPLVFNTSPSLLESIITIGYPKVPRTRDNYKYYHRGEVNSFVKNYSNSDLLIFSAKTSAGNSGSPVITNLGEVIGIITNELFNKAQFELSGTLPYYAAIPAEMIIAKLKIVIENSH